MSHRLSVLNSSYCFAASREHPVEGLGAWKLCLAVWQSGSLINTGGELQQWDAFLAIVATNATNATESNKATYFRCRKPTLSLPVSSEIDISRQSMLRYLTEGKRINTAVVDDEIGALREGAEVHCTQGKFLQTDHNEINSDNLGDLSTFVDGKNRM